MVAIAPRVAKLETDQVLLRRDHDCLEKEVHDPKAGLSAAHSRLNENDVLAAKVGIAISIGRWILITFGAMVLLLIFNLLTHAVEIVRP